MNWILVLALTTSPDGVYTRNFKTESQCVTELKRIAALNEDNPQVKSLACLNADQFAMNEVEE